MTPKNSARIAIFVAIAGLAGCGENKPAATQDTDAINRKVAADIQNETPPPALTVDQPQDGQRISSPTFTVSGTGAPDNAKITVTLGTNTYPATVHNGRWQLTMDSPGDDPNQTLVSVNAMDAAGDTDDYRELKFGAEPKPPARIETSDGRCAYNLPAGSDLIGSFVADIQVSNNGDGPGKVQAVARWERIGVEPFKQVKNFRLRAGQTRFVRFKRPASVDEILAHQKTDGECSVKAQKR